MLPIYLVEAKLPDVADRRKLLGNLSGHDLATLSRLVRRAPVVTRPHRRI